MSLEYQIRPYRSSDHPQIRSLVYNGYLTGKTLRLLGKSFMALGAALFFALQYRIRSRVGRYCDAALRTDVANIEGTYVVPGGGFWVAARTQPGGEEEILGCVGLQYRPAEHTVEVRRMIVACSFRRHGIARALMQVALAYADALPKVEYAYLTTSDLQLAGQPLYKQLGFVNFKEKEKIIPVWAAGQTTTREYRRVQGGGKVGL
ncbi:GNAT family acetyltransferase [Mycena kentingensis (nom. inval.)]|nr:GNAT family acetyltransferase [Mycena kentingensis (nom. inval.)]